MADTQTALARHLLAASGRQARLTRAESRAWASATFDGARHRLELAGPAAAVAAMLAGLEEREIALAGHFVADVAVTGRGESGGETAVTIEALTIAEA